MTARNDRVMTRRDLMYRAAMLAGAGTLVPAMAWQARAQQPAAPPSSIEAIRSAMGQAPVEAAALGRNLTLLSGPGGNVVVLDGADGKIVVDTFVQPAWTALKAALDRIGTTPVRTVIDTHWHFDHADNNASFREAGAAILAHQNTTRRLSESHDFLGMRLPASPPAALPTETFQERHRLEANGEQLALAWVPPAHTDTDIYVHYTSANVLHLGDLFFNESYPFFDASTGGHIAGMIAASSKILEMVDSATKIVPGHGPVGDKAAVTRFRDMMVAVRDRVQKLKNAGRTIDEVVAEKPTADFDPVWGRGRMQPDMFVRIVYETL